MTHRFSHDPYPPMREKRKQDYLISNLSLSIALAMRADPNTCFDNVLNMMIRCFPEVFSPHGTFVEGWYVVDLEDEVIINEHGWCELSNDQIIDPTVVILVPPERPVYYFPGVKRSWQEVKEIAQKKDAWFPYVRGVGTYGEDGLEHPAYKAAYEAARQKVFSLTNASQPPKRMTFLTAQDLERDQRDGGISVQMFIVSSEQHEEGQTDA